MIPRFVSPAFVYFAASRLLVSSADRHPKMAGLMTFAHARKIHGFIWDFLANLLFPSTASPIQQALPELR